MSKFKLFHYNLKTEKLPKDSRGLTFILLADLHNHVYGPENEELVEAVAAQKPDAVLSAGDMLIGHSEHSFAPALELFQKIRERKFPVFYGNGNHEYRMRMEPEIYGDKYERYTAGLQGCGVILLENKSIPFEKNGLSMRIYGFELAQKYYQKLHREHFQLKELTDALGTPDPELYNILLAHNPVYFPDYAAWGADLTVSGHLHGGIIRIPGIGGVITPQARLFPKYDAGHFVKNGRDLVVSRGLGTHTVNVRIFNPAELSVIHLQPLQTDNRS